jgi:chromosome segregation ATPase
VLADFRVDRTKAINEFEKDVKNWIEDAKKVLRTQIEGLEGQMKAHQDEFKRIKELEKEMSARVEEEDRLSNQYNDLDKEFRDIKRKSEDLVRQSRVHKEERQKEIKRLTDIQGEQSAIRKRVDAQSGQLDLIKGDLQKLKTRLEGLESLRRELKKEQEAFIEDITLKFTMRDNVWKSWQARFETIEEQAESLEEQMGKLDSTHRSVKRMQEEVSELSTLLDRRVNEITEMQRLAEERFRNEWSIFTADDQKRWTNYTLSQKELNKEQDRQLKAVEERITLLEDGYQEVEDHLKQLSTFTDGSMQSLLAMIRDWVGEYEQILESMR